jgi:hypothetical protein
MAIYRPLVLVSGVINQLPPGDGVIGGELTAGSGLSGGGLVQEGSRIDIYLSAQPSGLLIDNNNRLGIDGKAQASGNAALVRAEQAYQLSANSPFPSTEGSVGFLDNVESLSTVGVQLDTFGSGTYSSATYQVQAKRGNEVQLDDLKLLHNSTAVSLSGYNPVYTSGVLAAYSGELSGGQISLNAFSNTSDSTVFRVIRFAQAY